MSKVIFSDPRPLRHLLKEGFVFTVRRRRKRIGRCWIAKSRHGRKICDGVIIPYAELGTVNSGNLLTLRMVAKNSGFNTVDEWVDAIKKFHGKAKDLVLYIVFVKRKSTEIVFETIDEVLNRMLLRELGE